MKAKSGAVISEQDAGSVASYAGAGALTGAYLGGGVFSVPGALIGGAVGAIYGYLTINSSSSDGAKKILQACTNKKTVGPPTQSRQQLNAIADGLNTAIEGLGSDEKTIKANLQKITTIPDLCAMSAVYQTRHGESLWDALDGDIDEQSEWKNYVYLPLLDAYENSVELGKKVATAKTASARQQNINNVFCSIRNGNITTGAFKGQPWTTYKDKYKITSAEQQAAKQSCPKSKIGGGSRGGSRQSSVNNNVGQRFAKSTQSLGIQNGKMDVDTLQKILTNLEGGTQKAKNANDFAPQGVPADALTQQQTPVDTPKSTT